MVQHLQILYQTVKERNFQDTYLKIEKKCIVKIEKFHLFQLF